MAVGMADLPEVVVVILVIVVDNNDDGDLLRDFVVVSTGMEGKDLKSANVHKAHISFDITA